MIKKRKAYKRRKSVSIKIEMAGSSPVTCIKRILGYLGMSLAK
jgi:hypothetical protein